MKYIRIASLLIGGILLLTGILIYFNSPPYMMQDEKILIKEGDTLKSVSAKLKGLNLIKSSRFITLYGRVTAQTNIKPGKYLIYRGLTATEIIRKIVRGDYLRKKVTIPEGYNIYQIAERLSSNDITDYKDFIFFSSDQGFLRSIGINESLAEGYLFPDTYTLPEASDARNIITIMFRRFKGMANTIDITTMKSFRLNLHQLLTLASMIEKEARKPHERVYISAVFHNRLRRGMKFDCDPTIRYAVKKFKGSITQSDLEFNSPYNTYIRRGFPPTPICSPGLDSIRAALQPARVSFLYFVSRNDGSHYFSSNLREHNRAVEYYQKGKDNGFVDRQKL
jgi:UPF0755 protein